MKQLLSVTVAAVFALIVLGCADPAEFALFEADSLDELPECMTQEFPLRAELLAARERTGRLGIFLQTAPDVKSRSDLVYFELYQPEEVTVGDLIELSPPSIPPPPARGKMSFFSNCPYHNQAFELRGNLRFDSFEYHDQGVIAGELVDGSAIDPRTGTTVIENLSGSWSFIVRRGPPYEEFYALPERPEPGDF